MARNIVIACIITVLALLTEHWFPWRLLLRRDLHRVAAYVLGVLALALPLTALFWSERRYVVALWAVIVSGGSAVMLAHFVDWLLTRIRRAEELKELIDQQEGVRGRPVEEE